MSVIAILGAGRVGTAIARTAIRSGHEVRVAGSGPASEIELIVGVTAPGAQAATAAAAVAGADVVVLSLPLPKYRSLDPALLSGRVVVDAMNHWAPVDGAIDEFDDPSTTTSETVAAHLAGARVVKSLNHIGYHELESDRRPAGDPDRRALVAASDDAEAAGAVAALLETFGFDAVVLAPLAAGRALQPGSAIFGRPHRVDEVLAELGTAVPSSR